MGGVWVNVALILVFILIGGFFAASELALVSLRESQVRKLALQGRRGKVVERLVASPNTFLAALQVGVTLAGFLSAALGAATLAGSFEPVLVRWGVPESIAGPTALVTITIVISFFSLVLGELAPKRLALQRAEGIALVVAPVIDLTARVLQPVIWLLSRSTDLVVRLVGGDPSASRDVISAEELRSIVIANEFLGVEERRIVEDVLDVGDRQLREVMLPRTEVDFLDASLHVDKAVRECRDKPHSRYPVVRGSADDIVGFVHVRDLFDPAVAARSTRVADLAREVQLFPATKRVLPALSEMRSAGHHLAIVVDEYGGTAGIVTLEDLVEELIGDIRDEYDAEGGETRRLVGGSFEVEGLLNLEDFEDEVGFALPEGPYETVAGFMVAVLGRLPSIGDEVVVDLHRLEVLELDGRRIARVGVTQQAPLGTDPQPPEPGTAA
ncbi:MAG TPA: hemolysin family protein [Candidatus Limnocylindria bacterium]|nr:hemolysin family protein [Candidatus Limnocylindria bacterium]